MEKKFLTVPRSILIIIKGSFLIFALALFTLAPIKGEAASYIYSLDTTFSGTAPVGSPPWVTATFSDIGTNSVQLTVNSAGLTGSENIDKMYFNLNPSLNPSSLVFSANPLPAGTTIDTGTNAFKADGVGGFFDILFNYPQGNPSGRFGADQSYSYLISSNSGTLDASMFNFASVGASGPDSPYYAAAHIQNTGPNGNDSGWIGSGTGGVPAPEPSTYLLMGSFLGSILFLNKRRMNFQKNS